jgi:hypothetical protein
MLVPFTTLPIALRRYRPLAVLAVTVSAETALLLFSTQTQVPFGVIVALYTCQEGLSWRWRSRTREQPGCNTSVSSECFRRALARAVGYARALAGWRSFSCGWLLVTPCGSRALEGLVRWFERKVSERLYADFGSWW